MSTSNLLLTIANHKKRIVVEWCLLVLSWMRRSLPTSTLDQALEQEHKQTRQKFNYIPQPLPRFDIHSLYPCLQVDTFAHHMLLIPIWNLLLWSPQARSHILLRQIKVRHKSTHRHAKLVIGCGSIYSSHYRNLILEEAKECHTKDSVTQLDTSILQVSDFSSTL